MFELGIPGAVLYLCLVVREFGVCRWLLRVGRDDDVMRPVTALYVSLVLFYFLLSNKQGDLWGIVTLFMLVCAADRVRARAAALPDQAEFDGSREESASA
jgi:O-antigen ligase